MKSKFLNRYFSGLCFLKAYFLQLLGVGFLSFYLPGATASLLAKSGTKSSVLADQKNPIDRKPIEGKNRTALSSLEDWKMRVIYFAVVDRFSNVDSENDRAYGNQDCNDSGDPHAFQGGDLKGLETKLGYIKGLGASALWITPLYQGVPQKRGKNCGFTGYWADFKVPYSLQLDPRFGTELEFDKLIEGAHQKNMKVMLDMVVNHSGYDAAITRSHFDWFTPVQDCQSQGDPEIYCSLAGLPDFDHRKPSVQNYLTELSRQWVDRFDFDAIRMDTVKHVASEYFADHWVPGVLESNPDLYILGEILEEGSYGKFPRYLDAGMDGLFNFPLRRGLIETFANQGSVDRAAAKMQQTLDLFGDEQAALFVNLLDNHDVPRFLEEMSYGASEPEKQRRYLLALSALLTLPGIPQIYYGNEVGMYGGTDPYNRRFMPEWAFTEEGRKGSYQGYLPEPNKIFNYVSRLLNLRESRPALSLGTYSEKWRQNGAANPNVWAYMRSYKKDRALVVHNNGIYSSGREIPLNVKSDFKDGEKLVDVLNDSEDSFVVRDGFVRVKVPGQTTFILVRGEN